jgi:hypothetical protein
MHDHHLTPFVGQRYLNLESFKRDGTPIRTPVWFAEDHGVLYVYTIRWREIPRTHVLLTIVGWVRTGVDIVMAFDSGYVLWTETLHWSYCCTRDTTQCGACWLDNMEDVQENDHH